MVIGKVSLFADMVRDRLETADWATRRELICTLVKRIEIDDDTVRVIFRVEPGPSGDALCGFRGGGQQSRQEGTEQGFAPASGVVYELEEGKIVGQLLL